MNYKQRTLKKLMTMYLLQKTGEYNIIYCALCDIYIDNEGVGACTGCISHTATNNDENCSSFKTYILSRDSGDWTIRAEFWENVIPVLKAISKKYFTPRFCKAHPEKARKKFAFMVEIDQKIYNKYK